MKAQFLLAVLCGLAVLAAATNNEETNSEASVESNTATTDHEETEDEVDSSKLREETEKIVADVIANMLKNQDVDDEDVLDDDVDSELANDPQFLRFRYRYRYRPFGYRFGLYRPFGYGFGYPFGYGFGYRPFGYGFGYRRRFLFDGANEETASRDEDTLGDDASIDNVDDEILNEADDLSEDDEISEDPQRRIRIRIRIRGGYGRRWYDEDDSNEIEMDKSELEEVLNDIINNQLEDEWTEDPQRWRGGYGGRRGGYGGWRGGYGGGRGGYGGGRGGGRGGYGRRWDGDEADEMDNIVDEELEDDLTEDPQRRWRGGYGGRRGGYGRRWDGDEADEMDNIVDEELEDDEDELEDPQRWRGGYGGRRWGGGWGGWGGRGWGGRGWGGWGGRGWGGGYGGWGGRYGGWGGRYGGWGRRGFGFRFRGRI